MSIKPTFSCNGCAKCCKTLIGRNGTAGLLLLPEEIHLFPDNLIKPCQAVGTYPGDKKFYFINFQYIENICIYLKENKCTIYDKRPLACHAYPLRVGKTGERYEFTPDCPEVTKLKKQYGEVAMNISNDYQSAAWKIFENAFTLNSESLEMRPWIYNLKTQKWELFKN